MVNRTIFLTYCLTLTACILFTPQYTQASTEGNPTLEERIAIGKMIYRKGMLASGEAVKATVMGDIEVTGTQFTCINCHRRSGMGGAEGTKLVLPTNGPSLFEPRQDLYLKRPAYTNHTLIEALALGQTPSGELLDPVMPLYDLPDLEMDCLIAYLKTLSSKYSPGLDENVIHIATVVDSTLVHKDKDAMLTVLNRFFEMKNARTRREKRRKESGPFYHDYRNKAYRKWILHTWELKGPRESWPAQLDDYYRQQPVFAMLSGMVDGSWEPIHNFCEQNQVPCLLPNTDLPVVRRTSDFYSVYYSKGLTLEAEVALEDIEKNTSPQTILQVYRHGSAGMEAARILRTERDADRTTVHDLAISGGTAVPDWAELNAQAQRYNADVLVLWLTVDDLAGPKPDASGSLKKYRVYLSSSLIHDGLHSIPVQLRRNAQLIHPFNLPGDNDVRFRRLGEWLKIRDIGMTSPRIQGQTYYACLLLTEGLMHIRLYFYRDYLLDMIDHSQRMEPYVINYPRISFGPEQRYLAKGAYIIDMKTDTARWIVPYR